MLANFYCLFSNDHGYHINNSIMFDYCINEKTCVLRLQLFQSILRKVSAVCIIFWCRLACTKIYRIFSNKRYWRIRIFTITGPRWSSKSDTFISIAQKMFAICPSYTNVWQSRDKILINFSGRVCGKVYKLKNGMSSIFK